MSTEENKELIRRYIQAIDNNKSGDRSILDEFIAEAFVAHTRRFPAYRSIETA